MAGNAKLWVVCPALASSDKTSESAQPPQQYLRRNAFKKTTARSDGVQQAQASAEWAASGQVAQALAVKHYGI